MKIDLLHPFLRDNSRGVQGASVHAVIRVRADAVRHAEDAGLGVPEVRVVVVQGHVA